MKQLIFLMLISGLFLTCSDEKNPTQSKECQLTEAQAFYIAEEFQRENVEDWGTPVNTRYSDLKYYYQYTTPETEMGLLGPREIWVDCNNGKVGFTLRD